MGLQVGVPEFLCCFFLEQGQRAATVAAADTCAEAGTKRGGQS